MKKKCARFLHEFFLPSPLARTHTNGTLLRGKEGEEKKKKRVESPSGWIRACEHARACRRGWEPRTLPSRRFQVLLTLFSKFFASFPRGTCALSVFRLVFSFGRNLPPAHADPLFTGTARRILRAAFSDSPTHERGDALGSRSRSARRATRTSHSKKKEKKNPSPRDRRGSRTNGIVTLLDAPFQRTWAQERTAHAIKFNFPSFRDHNSEGKICTHLQKRRRERERVTPLSSTLPLLR